MIHAPKIKCTHDNGRTGRRRQDILVEQVAGDAAAEVGERRDVEHDDEIDEDPWHLRVKDVHRLAEPQPIVLRGICLTGTSARSSLGNTPNRNRGSGSQGNTPNRHRSP